MCVVENRTVDRPKDVASCEGDKNICDGLKNYFEQSFLNSS